jgi:formylglycine-generating enzyme required for sulfatase activity
MADRLARAAQAAALVLFVSITAPAQEAGMVRIPGGEFDRGRSHALPDDGLKWFPELLKDDRPVGRLHVDAFDIDSHEVTSREFWAFVRSGGAKAPYYWGGEEPADGKQEHPVANVSWQTAQAYCEWKGKRLPTEAEWEKAARGGLEKQKYPWGDQEASAERAHYDSVNGPKPVCSYERNGYGLCDMAGNVWEWTADWYGKDYYEVAPESNPLGSDDGLYRVLRGGSWADVDKFLTCAYRSYARPSERSPNVGFRCAKSANPKFLQPTSSFVDKAGVN